MTIERNRTSGQTGIHLSLLSAVVLALSLLGCIQAATAPSVPKVSGEPSNLLPNGSFESGGKPTLEGWQPMDSALATFESEAPTGGGGPACQGPRGPQPPRDHSVSGVTSRVGPPTGAGSGLEGVPPGAAAPPWRWLPVVDHPPLALERDRQPAE